MVRPAWQDELLRVEELVNADASDSSGEVDEDDFEEEEKRCSGPVEPREVPPGAPVARSAGEEVLRAVAQAGEAALPGGSSFGPRFTNLSRSELTAARSKWQLHSLAGVEVSSSEQNRRAAEDGVERQFGHEM